MANLTSLGGVLPMISNTLSAASSVEREVQKFSGDRDTTKLAARQLTERNRLSEDISANKTVKDQAVLDAQSSDARRRRDLALKRAVARQRAVFGGSGVEDGGDQVSGEAVLLGLTNDAAADQAADDGIYALRQKIMQDNLQSIRQRNLLEESQLRQRHTVKRGWLS